MLTIASVVATTTATTTADTTTITAAQDLGTGSGAESDSASQYNCLPLIKFHIGTHLPLTQAHVYHY